MSTNKSVFSITFNSGYETMRILVYINQVTNIPPIRSVNDSPINRSIWFMN